MPSDRALLEREMAEVELRPFTIDEFHRRRHEKRRNRRIATGVMGLVVAAVVAGGVLGALDSDDQKVDSDILGPMPSPFVGPWTSTDTDGSTQTMEILRTDGDEHEVVVHDDGATACSGAPSTLTGAARLSSVTELVLLRPLATCDDGSTPTSPDGQPLAEVLTDITFIHDPDTGTLIDSFGVVWRRPGAAPNGPTRDPGPIIEGPSPYEGSWVTDGTETVSAASMVVSRVADGDVHEIVMHGTDTTRCPGADPASTLTGTGRRATNGANQPGVLQLVLSVELTCDDGTTPVPATPAEAGLLDDFEISFVHDPETDEMVGSLGGVWWREGTVREQGDPMVAVDGMIDAVNAGDTDAFLDLFAPDGAFEPRGYFTDPGSFDNSLSTSEADRVEAWMAINDTWGSEADVVSCTADPADPLLYGSATDEWVECEVASRWPKLSLEITERWRFELRGERLVHWQSVPLLLDPPEREMPLGFPGLVAWERWLAANHPEDAARWLNPSADASIEAAGADLDEGARLVWAAGETRDAWVIDGFPFRPTRLVPYDPAFADEIQASINEYLEEQ